VTTETFHLALKLFQATGKCTIFPVLVNIIKSKLVKQSLQQHYRPCMSMNVDCSIQNMLQPMLHNLFVVVAVFAHVATMCINVIGAMAGGRREG